jgi:transposase
MSRFQVYVGLDWGTRESFVHAVDAEGRKLGERRIKTHVELLETVAAYGRGAAPSEVAVAVERRDLALVDALLEAKYTVFVINPKAVDRFRDRFSVAGAKDDRRDARVLATSLKTDEQAFEEVTCLDDNELQLRGLSRLRKQIERQRRMVSNQLLAELYRVFPVMVTLCPGLDQLWFWDLLDCLAKTHHPAHVAREDVAEILKSRRVRRFSIDDVMRILTAKMAPVPAVLVEELCFKLPLQLGQLRLLQEQRREIEKRINRVLTSMKAAKGDPPTDVDLLSSMPGFGNVVVAGILTIAGSALRTRDLERLRALTGQAPVTKRSGKSNVVSRRHACHATAREVMFHAASRAAMSDPRFKARYAALRARGHSRGRALRGVGDTMLHVLVAVLRTRKPYDAAYQRSLAVSSASNHTSREAPAG